MSVVLFYDWQSGNLNRNSSMLMSLFYKIKVCHQYLKKKHYYFKIISVIFWGNLYLTIVHMINLLVVHIAYEPFVRCCYWHIRYSIWHAQAQCKGQLCMQHSVTSTDHACDCHIEIAISYMFVSLIEWRLFLGWIAMPFTK